METHLLSRPKKTLFSKEKILSLREKACEKLKRLLLPSNEIEKIILMGSSVKETFGKYAPPGFRGSLFSDFDFIIFVKDTYVIPNILEREPDGKPFPEAEMNLAYRYRKFLENTYDAEIFFIRESSQKNKDFYAQAEAAGIPINSTSAHPFLLVFKS